MIREVWIGLFLMVASCAFATGEKVFRLGSPDGKLEVAEFNFDRDYKTCLAWSTAAEGKDPYAMAFQNVYEKQTLTGLDTGKVAFLPFVVDYGDGVKLTVTEADLEG